MIIYYNQVIIQLWEKITDFEILKIIVRLTGYSSKNVLQLYIAGYFQGEKFSQIGLFQLLKAFHTSSCSNKTIHR